jgi:signal transduction histidine kinase
LNISIMDNNQEKENFIHEAGREMNNLVMNILDVYKYENTSMVLCKEPVLLKELIEGALDDVSFLGKLRKVNFTLEIVDNIIVNLDRGIFHRVIVNLLTNAIKYSPVGGKIEIRTFVENHNYFKLTVKDNGPGIRLERQKTIFDRYQAGAQQDSLLPSTGLGLNFCKMAVESHGGTICVESDEQQGAKFITSLPIS